MFGPFQKIGGAFFNIFQTHPETRICLKVSVVITDPDFAINVIVVEINHFVVVVDKATSTQSVK
jgi:hypothetical protein